MLESPEMHAKTQLNVESLRVVIIQWFSSYLTLKMVWYFELSYRELDIQSFYIRWL